jgi:ADP-ribose pyrophosphatase
MPGSQGAGDRPATSCTDPAQPELLASAAATTAAAEPAQLAAPGEAQLAAPGEAELPALEASEVAYQGRVLSVRVDQLRRPDGSRMTREVVVHPDSVAVAAFLPDGSLVLIKQYRHPTGRRIWEVPAGKIDPGEQPLEAAQRELREECGLEATDWKPLLSYFSSPGFTSEQMHLFVARGCEARGDHEAEADIATWRGFEREELKRAAARGDLVCAKTLLALAACGLEDCLPGGSGVC